MKEGIERGIGAGRPVGSKGYYVHTGGAFITGSSEERREAWKLLPPARGGHKEWIADVMDAYAADCGHENVATYFGITQTQADKMMPIGRCNAERAKIWEYFA